MKNPLDIDSLTELTQYKLSVSSEYKALNTSEPSVTSDETETDDSHGSRSGVCDCVHLRLYG